MVIQGKRLRKSQMCAKLRWEMRLKPFGNHCSNTQIILEIFSTMLKEKWGLFFKCPNKVETC
jgi:hypothetical protein